MSTLSRRNFLKTAACGAAGAEVLATAAHSLAVNGTDYAIQGLDVASYQGYPNWTSVKNSGKTFAITKATEGTTYTNPYFATNWARIKSAGLIRGASSTNRRGSSPAQAWRSGRASRLHQHSSWNPTTQPGWDSASRISRSRAFFYARTPGRGW